MYVFQRPTLVCHIGHGAKKNIQPAKMNGHTVQLHMHEVKKNIHHVDQKTHDAKHNSLDVKRNSLDVWRQFVRVCPLNCVSWFGKRRRVAFYPKISELHRHPLSEAVAANRQRD